MTAGFWLRQWLDEYEITSARQARHLLRPHKRAVRRLREIAQSSASSAGSPSPQSGASRALLAGRGIDLSGDLDCCAAVCQRAEVDRLFGRVLHYFDEIIVAGPSARRYAESLESPDDDVLRAVAEHVTSLLYLREVGAEDLLVFAEKPPACEQHYRQHAGEVGLLELIDSAGPWIDRLAGEGKINELHSHDDHWHYTFTHHDLEHTAWGSIWKGRESSEPPSSRDIAESVFARYAAHLVSDVTAARLAGLPLGASVQLHESVLATTRFPMSVGDVAFQLQLPVLDALPIRDIVRIREDESEHFERFRYALTQAIEERMSEGGSPAEVAASITQNVIEPAISDIERRLHLAQRIFDRKIGVSVTVGTAVTTVGLLAGAPLIVGAGMAAIGTSLPVAHKYLEDKGSIELSDMFFLWNLQQNAISRLNRG